jgi:3-dehydroquinate dehydratase/shikimate dehydrogenase
VSTLLCVSILVQDASSALGDAHAARGAGADLVEYRVDECFSGTPGPAGADSAEVAAILRMVAESPLPCIVTCRTVAEGGAYDGDEPARISLFERLGTAFGPGEHPPRYIDAELAAMERSANIRRKVMLAVNHPEQLRDLRTSLILSMHDMERRPPDLARKLLRMRAEPAAAVLKIAYRARSIRDNLELFDLLADRERPTIALGMGEFGLMSRVLAPKFGGFLTFASLRPETATAPGQPTIRELLGLYRFRSIGPRTRVYGVVGWPIGHSLSPRVHNAGFEAIGHDGVYLPMPVPGSRAQRADTSTSPDEPADAYTAFKATVLELADHPRLDLAGLSVTSPHKENLVALAVERGWSIEPASRSIGAANTLSVERDPAGRMTSARVFNTDAPAVRDLLHAALGGCERRRIVVLGAGGAARAAAWALADAGAAVTIVNRTPQRAKAVADAMRGLAGTVAAGDSTSFPECDACVHCTPVGMAETPVQGQSPLSTADLRNFSPRTVVLDTVYAPLRTPLLRAAEAAGLRTIDGAAVFIAQAHAQFHAWTGSAPPRGLFNRIVKEHLR